MQILMAEKILTMIDEKMEEFPKDIPLNTKEITK